MLLCSLAKVLHSPDTLLIFSQNICSLSQKLLCAPGEFLSSLAEALKYNFSPTSYYFHHKNVKSSAKFSQGKQKRECKSIEIISIISNNLIRGSIQISWSWRKLMKMFELYYDLWLVEILSGDTTGTYFSKASNFCPFNLLIGMLRDLIRNCVLFLCFFLYGQPQTLWP